MTIGGINHYSGMNAYRAQYAAYIPQRAATTAPVEPVAKAPVVEQGHTAQVLLPSARGSEAPLPQLRQGADPVEMAVRGRIQYLTPEEVEGLIQGKTGEQSGAEAAIPGLSGAEEAKTPAEVMSESECQTCAERKYQDGSDDPGVSFKTPGKIAPEQATAVVRGHEMEHVFREQAKADREDRKVISQSVTLHSSICPECGKVYTSGGTTRTVTAAKQEPQQQEPAQTAVPGFEAVA